MRNKEEGMEYKPKRKHNKRIFIGIVLFLVGAMFFSNGLGINGITGNSILDKVSGGVGFSFGILLMILGVALFVGAKEKKDWKKHI